MFHVGFIYPVLDKLTKNDCILYMIVHRCKKYIDTGSCYKFNEVLKNYNTKLVL